jgi:hypothetical protein
MDTEHVTAIDWNAQLVDQVNWHWQYQLRSRLAGLTDAEYFWQPVPGCWTLSRRGESSAPVSVGAGEFTLDYAMPPPEPEPVTTIAWRLAHIIVGLFASRVSTHFGGPPADWATWDYAPTAEQALKQLDEGYAAWIAGVRSLGSDGLAWQVGPEEGDGSYAECPMAELVLHINRELLHHGAEIALLRDLYRWQ